MRKISILSRLKTSLRAAFLSLLGLLTLGATGGAEARGLEEMALDGREVFMYRADSVAGKAAPLVVVLHGGFQSGEKMAESLPLTKLAEKVGFNVVYPTGTALKLKRSGPLTQRKGGMNGWNAGLTGNGMINTSVNDVTYIESLIKSLVNQGIADPSRVVVVGHSNGAMMAYKLICERPNLVSSVVAIAGTPAVNSCSGNLSGTRILHIHGALDENQPAQGGVGPKGVSKHDARSVDETVQMMEKAGAKVTVHLVDRGGHKIDELNRPSKRQFGADIPTSVAEVVEETR